MLTTAETSLPPEELAVLCRKAEHEYADSPCGIMDQLCCTSARAGHALLVDCQSLRTQAVPLNLGTADLVVIDTGVRHSIAGAEYAARRRDCTLALEPIRRVDPSIGSFRELTVDRLSALERELGEVLFKRTRHVVTENARVARAAEALRAGDLNTFGQLMTKSHVSLRDDFAVSCPELDTVISAASSVQGVYGARMTGGGFGGCAIALARADAVAALHSAIHESYDNRYATPATLFTVHSTDAAQVKPT
jgi:galactokinase